MITRTKLTLVLLPAILTLNILVPAKSHSAEELDRIIAVVNEDVITLNEFEMRVSDYARQLKLSQSESPELKALKKQVLERMITNRVQLQQATQFGITIDDIALNRMLEKLASSNNVTLDQLRDTLEREGIVFERFREQSREELIIKQLQQRMVANKVNVTDQEINQFVQKSLAQESDNTEYHLLHILISTPENAKPEDIKKSAEKARQLQAKITQGADFSELAVRESDGRNALDGGDLGLRTTSELPEIFVDAVRNLEIGGTSKPVRSASGFHILKVKNKTSNRQMVIQTHARHILIRTGADINDDQARSTLAELRNRLMQGEDFAELASQYSQDPGSKDRGGDLGWADPGAFVSEFKEVMNSLKDGQLSEPFRSQFGWHLMQVISRRDQDKTKANIEAQARKAIRQRKIDEELRLWLRRIRDEAYVEYIDKTISGE